MSEGQDLEPVSIEAAPAQTSERRWGLRRRAFLKSLGGVAGGVAVLARSDCVQRIGILQAGSNGNEKLCALAGGRAGRSLPWFRSAFEATYHRMSEQLRTALDRGHWD